MKVARLYGFDDLRIEEEPVPRVGEGQALMRTRASGICTGETMPWYIEKKAPLVLGHEPAGEIVEVGGGVSSFRPGDRVFVHHHAPCLSCPMCRRGDHVQCETWKRTRIVPGGISQYILIPETNLLNDTLLLPPSVGFEDGALVEPLACVHKALGRASVKKGDTVLVVGLGVMGMLHVLSARGFGAGRVIGADRVPFRLSRALELGADAVIDVSKEDPRGALEALTSGEMAQVVVVGPGTAEALDTGLALASPGGSLIMFTPLSPGGGFSLDPDGFYFKDISLVASYSCGPGDTARALGAIEAGMVRAEMVVTHRFPIEETEKAYRLTAEAGESLKCMIVF